jgi:GntR family transcriptional regulator
VKFRLDRSSRVPTSAQLRDTIAARIRSGRLAPGDRIPPVRRLAAELALAPNTVAKAYRELEAAGYLVGRGRHGTFVAETPPESPDDDDAALRRAARTFAGRARQLGARRSDALAAVDRALRER